MKDIELSIVTITFNDPQGLQDTLDSLQCLLKFPLSWEHIIVDGSPEANKSILSQIPANWPLKHIVDSPPKGVYAAQNKGLQETRGQFIWVLNGGDMLFDVEVLIYLLGELKKAPEVGLASSGMYKLDSGKTRGATFPQNKFIKNILGSNKINHPSTIYRRSVFEKVGFYSTDFKIVSDYEHHIRCYLAGIQGLFSSAVLSAHDTSGLSSTQFKTTLSELKVVHGQMRKRLPLLSKAADFFLEKIFFLKIRILSKLRERPHRS